MRLYYHPFSTNARRAVVTAFHLRAPVELVVVDLQKGEQREPPYLKINPNGKVPVLEDDGIFLWESYAIMQYLADKTPGQTVYPTELKARADVNRWMFWCAAHFSPAVGVFIWENVIKPGMHGGTPDPNELKRGEKLLNQFGRVLDAHLAAHEWVSGLTLTLADFAIAAPLMMTVPAKLPVTQFKNMQEWYARIQATDAWKKASAPR